MKKLRSSKGFTLIELLIVVVIIGILATILITRFTGVKESAYLAHVNTMAAAVKTAALSYSTSRIDGAAPTTIDDLAKINPDIQATVGDMTLAIAGNVLTITHSKITTPGVSATVDLTTGEVTPASLLE